MDQVYSEISLKRVEKFRLARYVMVSPNPENDAMEYMERWAKNSGLLDYPGYTPRRIGWDFPFVTEEQKEKFGLHGYVAAYIIPEDFDPSCKGAELAVQETDHYAVITIAAVSYTHLDVYKRQVLTQALLAGFFPFTSKTSFTTL